LRRKIAVKEEKDLKGVMESKGKARNWGGEKEPQTCWNAFEAQATA